jgi:hypothetical protein
MPKTSDMTATQIAAGDEVRLYRPSAPNSDFRAPLAGLLPARIVSVLGFSGVFNVDNANSTEQSSTLAGINSAIAQLNSQSGAQNWMLYFPPGQYPINGVLTPADGDYSIIMAPGAVLRSYTTKNAVIWRIGAPNAQADGNGLVRFELAMEGRGTNNYDQAENVAFEIVNIDHYTANIRQAYKFVTGLRLIADGQGGNFHHYDATIEFGYIHSSRQHIILQTKDTGGGSNGAWMNNIRLLRPEFQIAATGSIPIRFISAIQNAGAGECKAVVHDPLCDGTGFTALYSSRGTVAVHGGHMEAPTWVIQHATGVAVAGDEPCTWIAPRLEDKQFLISDPDDVGSYASDPFWGATPAAQPKALSGSRNLTVGDIRAQRLLYNASASNFTLTIQNLTAASNPPNGARVRLARRSTGTLTIAAGSTVTLLGATSVAAASMLELTLLDNTEGAQVWMAST